MPQEEINIKTTRERFFQEYLILKKPVIDAALTKLNQGQKTTLSDIPRSVLAQLLYYNDSFRNLDEDSRWKKVFSKEIKALICENLDMKEHYLNVYISKLRDLKIVDGKKIRKYFVIYAEEEQSISFNFKINGYTQQ